MSVPEFSEFTYGYALTRDLERHTGGRLFSLPIFPNLRDEGKPGGGWDVKLKAAIRTYYFQFKIPQCMKRLTKDSKEVGKVTAPSYRMHLHKDTSGSFSQHNNLVSLSSTKSYVAYATPVFHTQLEIERSARAVGGVIRNSAFFIPKSIGNIADSSAHYVAYSARSKGIFCSDPFEFDASFVEQELEQDLARLDAHELDLKRELVQLVELIGTNLSERDRSAILEAENEAFQIVHLARLYLNCEVLFHSKP